MLLCPAQALLCQPCPCLPSWYLGLKVAMVSLSLHSDRLESRQLEWGKRTSGEGNMSELDQLRQEAEQLKSQIRVSVHQLCHKETVLDMAWSYQPVSSFQTSKLRWCQQQKMPVEQMIPFCVDWCVIKSFCPFTGCQEGMCRCYTITGRSPLHTTFFITNKMLKSYQFKIHFVIFVCCCCCCRSQPTLTLLVEFRCAQGEHWGGIWPRSMPCIGVLIPGKVDHQRITYLVI